MLLRSIAFAVLVLLSCPFPIRTAYAQTTPAAQSSPVDIDKLDARAFATLFRRVNSYEARAKAAPSPDKPEARLGTVVPRMFQLNDNQTSSLRRIALLWQQDSKVVHDQVRATMTQHHQNYQSSTQKNGPDQTFFLALQASQKSLDKITLQYRDALRNELAEADYQKLAAQARNVFAGTASTSDSQSGEGAR
jgi:hypothetical protein